VLKCFGLCSTNLCSLPTFLDNFTKVLLTSFHSCSAKFSNPQKLYDYYHWLLYSVLPGTRSTIPHYPPSHLLVHHHPRQTDTATEIPSVANMASGTFSCLAPQTCLLRATISITNSKWVRRPGFSRVALFLSVSLQLQFLRSLSSHTKHIAFIMLLHCTAISCFSVAVYIEYELVMRITDRDCTIIRS
jgi:hypothetical protein